MFFSIIFLVDGVIFVYVVDLDGDGNKDVFFVFYYDVKIVWYKNDGNGNLGV